MFVWLPQKAGNGGIGPAACLEPRDTFVGYRIVTRDQADALWAGLTERRSVVPATPGPEPARFEALHVAYYAGALLVMGAIYPLPGPVMPEQEALYHEGS